MTQRLDRIVIVAADQVRNRPAGMSVQHLVEVAPGRDVEIGPTPLLEADLGTYAQQWNAGIVAERDQLLSDKAGLEAQLATMTAERDSLQAQLAELQSPSPSNPRHIAPFDFLSNLLKPEEVYAVQTSTDPTVVVGRAKLQSIITYIDLDHPETVQLVNYLETAGIIAQGRAATILAGELPT